MDETGVLMNVLYDLLAGVGLALLLLLPPALKCELPGKIVVIWAVIIGLVTGALRSLICPDASYLGWSLPVHGAVILGITMSVVAWRFFRDPERSSPDDPTAVVSPADGQVIYINRFEAGQVPISKKGKGCFSLRDFTTTDLFSDGGYVIGIAMNYLDVHVNRAPVSGEIEMLKHIHGLFLSLKRAEALVQNERVLTVIRNGDYRVGVVQIASRLVRKIVSYRKQGSHVDKGERIGVIKLGSQVDLILPASPGMEIICGLGDCVHAGETILANIEPQDNQSSATV